MGGGFGGCTINLVKDTLIDSFVATVKEKYFEKFGIMPKIHNVNIGNGARRIE